MSSREQLLRQHLEHLVERVHTLAEQGQAIPESVYAALLSLEDRLERYRVEPGAAAGQPAFAPIPFEKD